MNVHDQIEQVAKTTLPWEDLDVVRGVPVDVQDVAFAGLCSALSVLTPEQKKNGAIMIDVGGGTTDYAAYSEGVVAAVGSLGIGGDHITNDVATGFNIPVSQAERLKRDSGAATIAERGNATLVLLPNAAHGDIHNADPQRHAEALRDWFAQHLAPACTAPGER